MKKPKITINLDEDIRNQDWLKRPDELMIHDLVREELKKKHERNSTSEKTNKPPEEKTSHEKP